MNPIFVATLVIVLIPVLVLIIFMSNLKKSAKMAEDKFKTLTNEDIKKTAEEETVFKNLILSYFSKQKLSEHILKNMCINNIKKTNI